MKIGMQTWGSHGDVRPFVALAEGLHAAGHEVSLVICGVDGTDYRRLSLSAGIALTVLDGPAMTLDERERIAETAYKAKNPMKQLADVLRYLYDPVEEAMFAAATRLCEDADLLIGHYITHPLQTASEKAGLPYVSVMLSHAGLPTANSYPKNIKLGKVGNRFMWWITKVALTRVLAPYPNRYRQRFGMPLVTDVLRQCWVSAPLTLLAISPALRPAEPDWPTPVRLCGFLDMPSFALEGSMPDALAGFLQAGEAPLYITFGSWTPKSAAAQKPLLQLLTQAVKQAGCRAIIQSPDWEACGFTADDQVLYVASAPHHAVFPHCFAVVHHGGAGTTQSVTLAGKPSIVVAHLGEQEHWGSELRRLGIGAGVLRRLTLTSNQLAKQIRLVMQSPEMRVKAEAVGVSMRSENGVAEAVKLINQTFGPAANAALRTRRARDSTGTVPSRSDAPQSV
jgi:sterol 3beta-glucosyltransferase